MTHIVKTVRVVREGVDGYVVINEGDELPTDKPYTEDKPKPRRKTKKPPVEPDGADD